MCFCSRWASRTLRNLARETSSGARPVEAEMVVILVGCALPKVNLGARPVRGRVQTAGIKKPKPPLSRDFPGSVPQRELRVLGHHHRQAS